MPLGLRILLDPAFGIRVGGCPSDDHAHVGRQAHELRDGLEDAPLQALYPLQRVLELHRRDVPSWMDLLLVKTLIFGRTDVCGFRCWQVLLLCTASLLGIIGSDV